jgi:hypothetical protein
MASSTPTTAPAMRTCKAIRLTEQDLKRLDTNIEKVMLRMAERFGDVDGGLERMIDQFLYDSRDWANQVRKYMLARHADGETWEL